MVIPTCWVVVTSPVASPCSPGEAGLPDGGGRRRTPGLHREEVAVLAGVGASWYQWLEQGRDITVSPQVLDSVARVLRLNSAELRHLYALAGLNPPPPRADPSALGMCHGLRRLIDAWMPFPANILDTYWNVVMYNDAATSVLGMRPEMPQNCLIAFFTDPVYRTRAAHWAGVAPEMVAQFRAACSDGVRPALGAAGRPAGRTGPQGAGAPRRRHAVPGVDPAADPGQARPHRRPAQRAARGGHGGQAGLAGLAGGPARLDVPGRGLISRTRGPSAGPPHGLPMLGT